jgi:hypothetical protein
MRLIAPESAGLPTLKKFGNLQNDSIDQHKVVRVSLVEQTPAIQYQLERCNGGGMPIFEEVPSEAEQECEVVMSEAGRPSSMSYAVPQSPENSESNIS